MVAARKDFVDAHPEAVEAFLKEYAASVEWVNANTADAAALIGEYGIVDAELAEKLPGYLQVLFEADPASVGGKLPEETFCYQA